MGFLVNNAPIRVNDAPVPVKRQEQAAAVQGSFGDVLSVQFSKHANMRLNARNINLSGDQLSRVEDGIGKAYEKGIRDSLVLVDDVALVVNVKSRTVITALQHGSDHVFSNIDGAVIV
ncbi:MAG: hypothetical protein LBR83_10765 [Clostridiales bacterium]|jgi:flagellar operon protein|nr:hypothetical protein [Clostridiales bacterium]